MSLAQWTEPKPCALSVPRFVRVKVYDGNGNPIPGEYRVKRISKPSCASGLDAIHSTCVDGKTFHLCVECSPADMRRELEVPDAPVRLEPAAPRVARDGDLVLVRIERGIDGLTAKLAAAGYRMRPRTRTVKVRGRADSRVQVWEPVS